MRLALLLTLAIGLGGCAAMRQTEPVARDDGIDREKMAQVEHQAQRTGVKVHWVNPPLKSTR